MSKFKIISLGVMVVITLCSHANLHASILGTFDENTGVANNDQFNHRVENAFEITDNIFQNANINDYIDIIGRGHYDGQANDFGDLFRVYLYGGRDYRAFTNPSDLTQPTVQDTTLTVVRGLATPYNSTDGFGGYELILGNDDASSGDVHNFGSDVGTFSVATSGYYYFYVSQISTDGTTSSVTFDAANGYSDNGVGDGLYGDDGFGSPLDGGMYYTDDSGISRLTGSVKGGVEIGDYYNLRIMQMSAGGTNPVPEPSSIAIFSVIGVGGLMLRRRMKQKNKTT